MLIKAVYCTKDITYAKRLSNYFDKEYGNKIELNICSSIEESLNFVHQYHVDIALFEEDFEAEARKRIKDIPCTCVFMAEQIFESDSNEFGRISKFQRGDRIYRSIFELYSSGEKVKQISLNSGQKQNLKVYVFTSASGGIGTTTIARAYAKKCAAYEKVLYLDLGLFNLSEIVEGNVNGLNEILLALKSRRNILPFKLQSAAGSMTDRVFTYGACSNETDLLELNAEDMDNLMDGIMTLSEYQKVIIDIGASIFLKEVEFMKRADRIICIVDESDIGKQKYEKFCIFLEEIGKKEQLRLMKKMFVFRNKIRQDYNNDLWNETGRVAGWAPYVSMNTYDSVIDRIAQSDSFSNMEMENAE